MAATWIQTGAALLAVVLVAGTVVARPLVRAAQPEATAKDSKPASEPMEAPDLDPAVKAAAEAEFLRPEEKRALRVFHGLATAEDLDTIERRAAWAVMTGKGNDPALGDPAAPVLDRAEGALMRGEPAAALALLADDASMRAVRLRVAALEMSGRFDDAITAAGPALRAIDAGVREAEDAGAVVDAVRAAAIVARLRAPERGAPDDHRVLMQVLASARAKFNRLDWRIDVAEAELLIEKDSLSHAQEALDSALTKNPSSAAAWALVGQMAVGAFDMDSAEAVASRLDVLADGMAPAGAVIRARAMLRQNDPELAADALAAALARYPKRRELLEMRAAVQSLRFDEPGTEGLLAEYDALFPNSARALYETGKATAEARQYARAADLLRRATERQPFWATPVTELGLLFIQSGEDEDALRTLERATELDPFNVRAANCLTLIRDILTYTRHESDHFVVRSKPPAEGKPDVDGRLAREMLPVLELNHRKVTGAPEETPGGLDHVPAQRTIIELLPNHRAFAVRIVGMTRIHTIAAATGPIIAMEAPRDGAGHSGAYDWERVLRHEYTHTVGLSKTGNRIPHWFTEAQAVFLEQSPRDFSTVKLLADAFVEDELFDFVGINIAFVRPRRPQDRSLAYAQGHWMYEYMVETFGPRAPLKLMEQYAKGIREEEAFNTVLEVSREKFFSSFRAWAQDQLIAWGMLPPAGMPTVLELLKAEAEAALAEPAPPPAGEPGPAEMKPPEEAPEPEAPQPTEGRVSKWLEQYPKHPEVLELAVDQAVQALGGAEPTATLAPLLERYAAARPVDPKPHRLLARLYLALPMPTTEEGAGVAGPLSAIPHLEFLDAREDRLPVYAAQLASLYAQAGDLEKASAKAERATRVAPYEARHRELAAGIALQRQDPATAKRHIEMLRALEPDRAIHQKRLEAVEKLLGQG